MSSTPLQQEWYVLADYPKYEINKLGQIRSVQTKRIIKPQYRTTGVGYITVVANNGKRHYPTIERLVAETFLVNENPIKYSSIKHIDGDLANCSVDNLIWAEDDDLKSLHIVETQEKPEEYYFFYPLIEFPDSMYEINKMGQIRNRKSGKLLKGAIRDGYLAYTLLINKKIVFRFAHIMVAKQFIPNPENKTIVNHIDENRINPCVDNLEWTTPSENTLYGNSQAKANLGRKKPINEYTLDGTYVRTWKSLIDLSRFFNSLYPNVNNKSNLQRVLLNNTKENTLKIPIANRIFIYFNGEYGSQTFQIKKTNPRAYKNHSLDGVDIPNHYLFDESALKVDYMLVLNNLYTGINGLSFIQKQAIKYAMNCIDELYKQDSKKK